MNRRSPAPRPTEAIPDQGYRPDTTVRRWLDGPGAGGRWKAVPEDFFVEELPGTCKRGRGMRWYRLERVGMTTPEVARWLAKATGASVDHVTWAGLKDREARVIQRFTVFGGRRQPRDSDGVRVLDSGEAGEPLRPGQLDGNRFELHLRGANFAILQERLSRLSAFPNRFGPQRVAHGAPEAGGETMRGRGPKLEAGKLRFALIAWQAKLFNRVLDERGPARLSGDLVRDGVPTGPLYGAEMPWPRGAALALEEGILATEQLAEGTLERFARVIPGERRALWVRPQGLSAVATPDGARLSVTLPPGVYATSLLQELL